MNVERAESVLAEQGWVVFDLPDPSAVFETRDVLLKTLEKTFPTIERLEDYHDHITSEEQHVAIVHELATFCWQSARFRPIIERNLDLFRRLIGADLHIQAYPYLRIVRPNIPEDAAPLHRDTYYGASPFEVSVVVPFSEMTSCSALRVVARSHIEPDSTYPYTQTVSSDVQIKSKKHQLGYPYAPRLLATELINISTPVPVRVGQVLVFPLQLVHGGGVNASAHSRFSVDIRLANSLAPVNWSRGVRDDYFVPLCASAVTRSAQAFLIANGSGNSELGRED